MFTLLIRSKIHCENFGVEFYGVRCSSSCASFSISGATSAIPYHGGTFHQNCQCTLQLIAKGRFIRILTLVILTSIPMNLLLNEPFRKVVFPIAKIQFWWFTADNVRAHRQSDAVMADWRIEKIDGIREVLSFCHKVIPNLLLCVSDPVCNAPEIF